MNVDKSAQLLPMPQSNGVAIQFINDPNQPISVLNPNNVLIVDTDTCDFATNPMCSSNFNYPVGGNAGSVERNLRRETRCASDPTRYYCQPVSSVNFATDDAELLAYYDGAPPIFALYDETDPLGGINLTYPVRNEGV